jgi:hypothetical protein
MAARKPAAGPGMRLDASERERTGEATNGASGLVLCVCGCGERFRPVRHQRFVDDAHRKRAWVANNSGPLAIAEIRARLRAIENHLGIGRGASE